MRYVSRSLSLLAIPLLLGLAVSGTVAGQATAAAPMVKTSAGHILVNAKGMTLYVFSKDSKGKSTCTGQCAKFWPPLLVPMGAKVPATMSGMAGTFGEIMLAGGGDQLTYDGAPLYTFANDKKPGDINGEGVATAWWAVVVPASAPM